MKRMVSKLVVESLVVVNQSSFPPIVSATLKCVEELLDTKEEQQTVLLKYYQSVTLMEHMLMELV